MNQKLIVFLFIFICCYSLTVTNSGCAQIGMPTGGDKDSVAPILVRSSPEEKSTNVTGNKISLTFNKYIAVDDVQSNVLISPTQKNYAQINYNLKTITIRLKDTLLANTTYSINFGNSIKDVNEGNIFKEYTYVFSTGPTIDSLKFSGKIMLAENGKTDSTMIALLYRNADDTSVSTRRPDYIARVNGDGSFHFKYLPAGRFKVYALKDGDGNKFYNSKTEMFAFRENNEDVVIEKDSAAPITLYAYQQELQKETPVTGATAKPKLDKKLKYIAQPGKQDLLSPVQITFNNPVKIDSQKIYLTDTNFVHVPTKISIDSTNKIVLVNTTWAPETNYILMVEKDAAKDSLENSVAKNDTVKFITKRTEDYGRIVLRFTGLDLARHPVLQLLEGETVKFSYPLTAMEWSNQRFPPAEYGIRILYDTNQNGVWDPGDFKKNLQPEKTIPLTQKLGIRADWDNEREIKLD